MDVSEESLLDYFHSAGCKVKNSALLKTYKPFIGHSDLQLRAKYREEFKLIIDRIAVVKSENGEKYLVLKKRYRQLLQDRDPEHHGADGEEQANPARTFAPEQRLDPHPDPASAPSPSSSPAPAPSLPLSPAPAPTLTPAPASAPASVPASPPGQVRWCGGPSVTITEAPDQESPPQDRPTWSSSQPTVEEASAHSNEDDDGDRDSGSKSESEQEEEVLGSTAVALDPVEKEWIFSAACGCFSELADLLRQDPSLAHKKDFTSGFTALHWAAKHGKEDMATLVANAGADVNTKSYAGYTPLHVAALHGHRHILELLIQSYGAKESLRDYSGHLACHYLNIRDSPEEDNELQLQASQAQERRNRKLPSLFQSRKKWGSVEDLAPIEEERPERPAPQQLNVPVFRTRKFSR